MQWWRWVPLLHVVTDWDESATELVSMKPIKSRLRRSLFWGADATLMKIFFHRDRNLFILS